MRKTLCSSCGKYFSCDDEFDRHRTGTYEPSARRCLTDKEMKSKGFVSEPHVITDETGCPTCQVWFRQAKRQKMRQAFSLPPATGIVAGVAA